MRKWSGRCNKHLSKWKDLAVQRHMWNGAVPGKLHIPATEDGAQTFVHALLLWSARDPGSGKSPPKVPDSPYTAHEDELDLRIWTSVSRGL
jgi:hypothetical protein